MSSDWFRFKVQNLCLPSRGREKLDKHGTVVEDVSHLLALPGPSPQLKARGKRRAQCKFEVLGFWSLERLSARAAGAHRESLINAHPARILRLKMPLVCSHACRKKRDFGDTREYIGGGGDLEQMFLSIKL